MSYCPACAEYEKQLSSLRDELERVKGDRIKLRAALVGLVDADGIELDVMATHLIEMTRADDPNRKVTLNAITALRETL